MNWWEEEEEQKEKERGLEREEKGERRSIHGEGRAKTLTERRKLKGNTISVARIISTPLLCPP